MNKNLTPANGQWKPVRQPAFSVLFTETLMRNFAEVAEKLSGTGPQSRKNIIGNLREMLDEIEQRVLADSGALSEAQKIAIAAAKSGANHGKK